VYGKLKFLVYSNLGVCVVSLALAFALSPRYGATGAAVASGATMAAQNIVNQIALIRVLGWGPDPMRWIRPYLAIAAGLLVLVVIELLVNPGFLEAMLISAVVTLGVVRVTRRALDLLSMFPELRRVKPLRWLLA